MHHLDMKILLSMNSTTAIQTQTRKDAIGWSPIVIIDDLYHCGGSINFSSLLMFPINTDDLFIKATLHHKPILPCAINFSLDFHSSNINVSFLTKVIKFLIDHLNSPQSIMSSNLILLMQIKYALITQL